MIEIRKQQIAELLDSTYFQLSSILPSQWAEANRRMGSAESKYKGKFSYDITPYCKEIVDCCSPTHPAKIVSVMKGQQVGFSTGVIEPAIGWTIAENPGNILFLTGHSDLADEAVNKLDLMIDSCGIRHLIRPQAIRAKSMKTGDTNSKKEFPGGSLVSGGASNHKLLRQRSIKVAFIDDFDAAKSATKESGSTRKMIEGRLAAYFDEMKLFYISTPELKQTSNIEPVYYLGDQRKYKVPCPCCGDFINLEWEVELESGNKAGITYKVDDKGKLIKGTVGYICQSCGGFFTDAKKYEMNINGIWTPTAEPFQEGYYSYHLSSLYAPPGMKNWEAYVYDYLEACPIGQPRKEHLYKTFVNLCLGQTYEEVSEEIQSNALQKNIMDYEVGSVPEKLSLQHGNGKIVLITCAADLNGVEDDARLDYEVVAWSENGSSYSITHGSIGTFVPRENLLRHKEDRERWSYRHGVDNSVWTAFEELLQATWITDTGRKMKAFVTGLDVGYMDKYAWAFIDRTNNNVLGLKGKNTEVYVKNDADRRSFKSGQERGKLYIVEGNMVKDDIADLIRLNWEKGTHQPAGFMNFPTPSGGKYLYQNYFAHYEAEHKQPQTAKDGTVSGFRWVKKDSTVQNHLFDCRVYNMVVKDIIVWQICRELKIQNGTWADFVNVLLQR